MSFLILAFVAGCFLGTAFTIWVLGPAVQSWERIKRLADLIADWRLEALKIDRGICGEEELAQRDTLYQCADQVEAALKPCNTTT